MSRIRTLIVALLVAAVPWAARAQTAPPDPLKTEAKKAKKAAPKKAAAKKPPAKKTATKQPEVIKMNTDKPLVLRDKDGNVIPTSPDAYNVDSARSPKKK